MLFDVALIEKPEEEGMTFSEVMDLLDSMKEPEVFPIEIENPSGGSVAMGFISVYASDSLSHNYAALKSYLQKILSDMSQESELGIYQFRDLDVFMSRNM